MDSNRLNRPTLFLLAALVYCLTSSTAGAEVINDRMSLQEAITAVRAEGIEIAYSTTFVKPWMRVRSTPQSSAPLAALQEALAEYNLQLEAAAGGRWLIIEGQTTKTVTHYFVRGQVVDAATGAPVRNARVSAGPTSGRSDADGRFELVEMTTGEVDIRVTAKGYEAHVLTTGIAGDIDLDIELRALAVPSLDEVTIVASQHSVYSRDSASGQFLSGEDIRLMPHLADDAYRVFHKLPGVAANDFQAPFNLRGGASDEVKVVLDGLELFEPYHMRTLFNPLSIIDPGIIGQANMLSGGFTAEYGNQMSGVVDFSSAWPTGEPVHQLGVSFVSSFARSSGVFAEGHGAYQISLRRGYLDLLADAVTDEGEELSPRYGDVFAKLNYQLNDVVDLSAQMLSASDDVTFIDPGDGEDFGGESKLNYVWLSVDAEPSDRVTWTNALFAGRVEIEEAGRLSNPPFEFIARSFRRDTDIAGLQSDISWQQSDRAMWKAGVRYRDLAADYDYFINSRRQTDFANGGMPYRLLRDTETSRSGGELGAHLAFRFRVTDRMTAELGVRRDEQTYTNTSDETQLSPRVNAFYRVSDATEIRVGWGHYHQPQGIQDLQVQDGVTEFHPAQRAEHRIIGVRHRRGSGLELQMDIYQKKYTDLKPRFENAFDTYEFAPESNFDRIRVDPDTAEAKGIEFTLRSNRDVGLDWWLNYTWSEVEDVVDGVSVPRSWDQRHAATAGLTWRGEKWNLSTIARYHSGWPRTPLLVLPIFDNGGNFQGANSDLTQRNSSHYDDYSRVDVRLSRTLRLDQSNFEFYLEIFNLFNSENQCCVGDHDLQIGPSVTVSPNVDDYLPFFPSFGFVWTFGKGVR